MVTNKKGFTLAELLTVVAVLAILVMISIPLISGRIDKAQAETCKTNRQALMNGTTTGSMTDKIDWTDTDAPASKENIIAYLIDQGYISEAPTCPSKGQIYVNAVTKDTIYFNCTFHDDGVTPGEESPTILLDKSTEELKKAIDDFALEYIKQNPNRTDNASIVKAFLNTGDVNLIKEIDLSSLLTDKDIREIVKYLIDNQGWSSKNEEAMVTSLKNLVKTQTKIVPYMSYKTNQPKQAIVYTVNPEGYKIFTNQGHGPTSFICYKDSWYLYASPNYNLSDFSSPQYIMSRFDSPDKIEGILSNQDRIGAGIFIKIS